METFVATLERHQLSVVRGQTEILQVNLGKRCNQACAHCHVEAGPKRTESMSEATVDRVLELLAQSPSIHTLDITGGAPELHPHFSRLVVRARLLGKQVIDRCNLTVLLESGQDKTAEFLRDHAVRIVASMPCYSKTNVEKQRGLGVFDRSIAALRRLNQLEYGKLGSGLVLDLVYNPGGAFLPGPQAKLEADYRRELFDLFQIEFNHLFTITNMPIKRFLHDLERQGHLQTYMDLLVFSFTPAATAQVMCKTMVSVSYEGGLYDCDFNQMLELPLGRRSRTVWEVSSFSQLEGDAIAFANHCYGCTAGAGSSCGGALIAQERR